MTARTLALSICVTKRVLRLGFVPAVSYAMDFDVFAGGVDGVVCFTHLLGLEWMFVSANGGLKVRRNGITLLLLLIACGWSLEGMWMGRSRMS